MQKKKNDPIQKKKITGTKTSAGSLWKVRTPNLHRNRSGPLNKTHSGAPETRIAEVITGRAGVKSERQVGIKLVVFPKNCSFYGKKKRIFS